MAQRLGDILLQQGAVTKERLAAALSDQRAFGGKLGRTLVDLGYVSEDALLRALAAQLGLQVIDLERTQIDEGALGALTVNLCERFGIFPVRLDPQQRVLWLATSEPDLGQLQEVAQLTQLTLEPMLSPMSAIERALRRHYYGEAAGHVPKRRKGEPLTAIPVDSGLPKEKPPPGKLPSSASAVLHDPEAPPEPTRRVEEEPPEVVVEPLEIESNQVVAPAVVRVAQRQAALQPKAAPPQPKAAPPQAKPIPPQPKAAPPQPAPSEVPAPVEVIEPEALPPEAETVPEADPEPALSQPDESFESFAQMETQEPPSLHAISPGTSHPDAIEELQQMVLRLEKLISAQGRAFRALIELLQEKGVVRRGELGQWTKKE
jgi:type IV pilus assembly protein PilB